jgi:hypothetical protein
LLGTTAAAASLLTVSLTSWAQAALGARFITTAAASSARVESRRARSTSLGVLIER